MSEIAEIVRATPGDRVFDAVASEIARGAGHREVLAATLLAGVLDVRPWPPGLKFHTVLMAPPALDLAEAGRAEDLWLPVFFNVATLKRSQGLDRDEGDWTLPEAPRVVHDEAGAALAALEDALEAWDLEAADRAVTAAVDLVEPARLFEVLWRYGARDFHNIGHLMIHTSQMFRAIPWLPHAARIPAIRSLVHGLLSGTPGATTAPFEANRRRVAELPSAEEGSRGDAREAAFAFADALRTATVESAVDVAIAAAERGVGRAALWDGLRLAAADILFRSRDSGAHAQLLAVHPMTIVNAFHIASAETRSDDTRALVLLQAIAWTVSARDFLVDAKDLSMEGPGLAAIAPHPERTTVAAAVEVAETDPVASASRVRRLASDRAAAERYVERVRSLVVRKAPEHHHHKYASAVFEEAGRSDPAIAPTLLAACLSYLPRESHPDSRQTVDAREALIRHGIRSEA